MRARLFAFAILVPALLLGACASGKRGRIMSDSDQDFVGNDRAGAATYDRLIQTSVERLLKNKSAAATPAGKLKIAILGVENKTVEELRDFQEQIYELISTSINVSDRYSHISQRFVAAALRETRLGYEDLFLPAKRRQFVSVLEASGNPVDALLFPKLTSGTTDAGQGATQRNYTLTLELVDVKTGESERETARIRKEYRN